jgi:hypothetical protein
LAESCVLVPSAYSRSVSTPLIVARPMFSVRKLCTLRESTVILLIC